MNKAQIVQLFLSPPISLSQMLFKSSPTVLRRIAVATSTRSTCSSVSAIISRDVKNQQLPTSIRSLGNTSSRNYTTNANATGAVGLTFTQPQGSFSATSDSAASASASTPSEFDVVIIGGGMVGTTLAATLATSPLTCELKIALVDPTLSTSPAASKPLIQQQHKTPDMRSVAVTPLTIKLFQAIGVWDQLVQSSPYVSSAYYDNMEVWDAIGGGAIHFNAGDVNAPYLGYIVENNAVVDTLIKRLEPLENVTLMKQAVRSIKLQGGDDGKSVRNNAEWEARIGMKKPTTTHDASGSGVPEDRASLKLDSGQQLSARLVIGSDGARSRVRELMGMPSLGWDYKQRAVVATITTAQPHNTAYQRFLPTGPIAMLPAGRDDVTNRSYSNIVWSTTPAHADWLLSVEPGQFVDAVNYAFHGSFQDNTKLHMPGQLLTRAFLGGFGLGGRGGALPSPPLSTELVDNKRGSFPLRASLAKEYVKKRLALIGDAAHTVHPLAGQGVNMGIADVVQLSRTLIRALESGTDIGDLTLLRNDYECPRARDNALQLAALDAIKRTFSLNVAPFAFLRSTGMTLLDSLSPIKNQIIKAASGKEDDISILGTASPRTRATTTSTTF